jgi:hypothetical protein
VGNGFLAIAGVDVAAILSLFSATAQSVEEFYQQPHTITRGGLMRR